MNGSVKSAAWLSACGLAIAACGGFDPQESEPQLEPVEIGMLSQAFSEAECEDADDDVTIQIAGGTFSPSHTSPTTYSNPDAFKSYIWDFKRTDAASTGALPLLNVAASFPATRYDTAAECTGIRLKHHVFFGADRVLSGNSRGFWDDAIGCTLPYLEGPFMSPFIAGKTIRVCGTAREANTDTIPMTVRLVDSVPLPIGWSSPRVKKSGGSWRIRADASSGDAYCRGRGFERMLPCVGGSCPSLSNECSLSYVQWSDFRGEWVIPAVPVGTPCQNVWTLLFCE